MCKFITLTPTANESETGEERTDGVIKPVRVNTRYITDYRVWLNQEKKDMTVVFFDKSQRKPRMILDLPIDEVDKLLDV